MNSPARFLVVLCALAAASWSQVARSAVGPYGGWINDMTQDGSGRLLAACSFGGIYRTSDNGESWAQIYNETQDFDPVSVAVAANGHILIGGEGFFVPGIRRSTDDGATWQILSNALSTHGARTLRVLPNGEIFACTFNDDGLYRSNDNGSTFTAVSSLPALYTTDIEANSSGHLFVSTRFDSARMYRSTDNGTSWQLANVGLAGEVSDIFITASNVLYAASSSGLYRSTDNGATWTSLNAPANAFYGSVVVDPGGVIYAAFAAPAPTGGGVYRSADDGATWTQDSGLLARPVAELLRATDGTLFSGGPGSGIYRRISSKSTTGAAWEWKNNGLANTFITAIAQDALTGTVYAGTAHLGVFRSLDGGQTWQRVAAGIPEHERINALTVNIDGTLFASGVYQGIYRSTDGGITWTVVSPVAATALACNAQGRVFAGLGSRMYWSTNNGNSWNPSILASVQHIADIAFDGATVYVATGTPSGFGSQGVRRSTDDGVTWVAFNNGLTNLNVTCVDVGSEPPGTPSRIRCGTDGSGVFFLDEAATRKAFAWVPCVVPLADPRIIDLVNQRELLLATRRRITAVRGPYDACIGTALGNIDNDLEDIEYALEELSPTADDPKRFPGDGSSAAVTESVLFVGTTGGGIVRLVSSPVGVGPGELVRRSALTQNQPNPFNPRTQIRFEIGAYGPASLRVYDVHGREVVTLVDGMKSPGAYEITWDASDRPSGVYYYQLRTGDHVASRKMALIK